MLQTVKALLGHVLTVVNVRLITDRVSAHSLLIDAHSAECYVIWNNFVAIPPQHKQRKSLRDLQSHLRPEARVVQHSRRSRHLLQRAEDLIVVDDLAADRADRLALVVAAEVSEQECVPGALR